jgi:hypothetical protein
MTEAEHFWKCEFCGGWFDIRDLGAVSITKSPCPIQHAIRCSSLTGHQRSVVMRRRDEHGTMRAQLNSTAPQGRAPLHYRTIRPRITPTPDLTAAHKGHIPKTPT